MAKVEKANGEIASNTRLFVSVVMSLGRSFSAIKETLGDDQEWAEWVERETKWKKYEADQFIRIYREAGDDPDPALVMRMLVEKNYMPRSLDELRDLHQRG